MLVAEMTLHTERLTLRAMTAGALDAWVRGDRSVLEAATGAHFPPSLAAPPLFDEDLPGFRDRMVETPEELGWWVWLVMRRSDRLAVGVCGLGGRPGSEGAALLGYSVYPEHEGCGYATEASRALVAWVLAQPGVILVRATVPKWNHGSEAVARKLGMTAVGWEAHPQVGEVTVYETGECRE